MDLEPPPDIDSPSPILVSDSPSKSDPTLWIPHLGLYHSDKQVLQSSDKWLTDNIIYAAQILLKNQSKQIYGWMDTQCSKRKELFPAIPPNSHFIQILHVNGSHWICVSNVNAIELDTVMVYDSGCPSHVPVTIQMAVCSILRPQSDMMNFDIVNVQCQPNGSDCGLFAIAFATELVHDQDPALCHFDTTCLRQHLLNSFDRDQLDRFPLLHTRRIPLGRKLKKSQKEKIYCICRTVNDVTRSMIQCSQCGRWYHHDCEDLDIEANNKIYTCSLCQATLLKLAE